jgi:outer membrane receptor for ferrienterochelin and colicin
MKKIMILFLFLSVGPFSRAAVDGAISGSVQDPTGVALPNVMVQLVDEGGGAVMNVQSSATGEYRFFPVQFGDYQISVKVTGFIPTLVDVHVSSGAESQVTVTLQTQAREIVLNVKAKKRLIQKSASVSRVEINKEAIANMPQGENIKLPKLLASTTPGIVQGAFGQSFIRGNHANIQYQIDGVQLPDSPSNTFGEAFSPRNIDHMEVITGGVPAEYGERLAAVVNIVTKSGTETPQGGGEVNYGSYNTFSPFAVYGGSNADGRWHYYASAGYSQSDRGLDTPQPRSTGDQTQGGDEATHDQSNSNNEFAKIDWFANNENKFSLVLFNSYSFYQIPNYPSSFSPKDPFFQAGYKDAWGNQGAGTTFNYSPANTDDTQAEQNSYLQLVWKTTLSPSSFLQVAPYYKYSFIRVTNDPSNDLISARGPAPFLINGSTPSSFSESRKTDNYGIKADYTNRLNDSHLVKFGSQVQSSLSQGAINVIADSYNTVNTPAFSETPSNDNSSTAASFESVYLQDDFSMTKALILNAGLRFDAVQFSFASQDSSSSLLQPRIGLNYSLSEETKVHIFYGKLFQPAPAENLRDTFVTVGANPKLLPYDIKPEKDDYYEVGIAQQWLEHVFTVNVYYKDSVDQLDDAQLLNTSIAQPYNFARGIAYGIEVSVKGILSGHWSDFMNYSYEIAKGNGLSGGLFTGQTPSTEWQYLDHVQMQTANLGLTYSQDGFNWTNIILFGSGLRTGPNNNSSLPQHITLDTTVNYKFAEYKVGADILNIGDNVYPISIANGFNGSHYASGRQYFVHLGRDF